jgi:predicted secreted protein
MNMATNAKSGMKGSLWVSTTQVGDYKKVAELTDMQLRIDAQEIDVTHVDSGGWGDTITGKKQWELTPKNNLITTDADGYGVLMSAMLDEDTILYFKILSEGTPTTNPVGWHGAGRVLGSLIQLAGQSTGQRVDWTVKGSGPLSVIG